MPNSKINHPQLENDKIKPVIEVISFFEFEELSYFEEKEAIWWFSLFHKSELHTAITFIIYNRF